MNKYYYLGESAARDFEEADRAFAREQVALEREIAMSDRYTCTADAPWTPEKGPRAEHPDAEYVEQDDYSDGDSYAVYKCPHCGKTFSEELAR